jgi:peptidoglycan-associated lipoprotein
MRNTSKLAVLVIGLLIAGLAVTGCARKSTKTAGGAAGLQKIHFDFDKYNIKSEYEGTLKSNADWLQKNKKSVVVEGYCDERGTAEYNIALGDRRAKSAKGYMKNLGVNADKMSTISYGKEKPIATCHNESCWSQNRRAEFIAK